MRVWCSGEISCWHRYWQRTGKKKNDCVPCCCITEEQFWRCTSMVLQIWAHLQQIVFYFIPLQNISERFLQAADSFEMTELQQLWDGRLWVGGEVNHSQLLRFSCKTNQAITRVIIVFQSFFSRSCLTWAGSSSLNVKTCCFFSRHLWEFIKSRWVFDCWSDKRSNLKTQRAFFC